MKIFTLENGYSVVCQWVKTRTAFKHTAVLCLNGIPQCETKICYVNRTWEAFEYESVLMQVIDLHFTGKELTKYRDIVKNSQYGRTLSF